MKMNDLKIVIEYTGKDPNLRPAASAFARLIRKATNPDGSFSDPELEAEFQQWMKDRSGDDIQKGGKIA